MNQILVDLLLGRVIDIDAPLTHPNIILKTANALNQAVFEIDFEKPRYTTLNVIVECNDKVKDWSFHIADKFSCNGFGGDSDGFGTGNSAELQILNQSMTVWSRGLVPAGGVVDQLTTRDLLLKNSAMKFVVKNQYVSWGQPYEILQTPNSKTLFAIPDIGNPGSDKYKIYVGLNRVVANAGSTNRTGTGVIRAIITLE
jgi:hypothetical protein